MYVKKPQIFISQHLKAIPTLLCTYVVVQISFVLVEKFKSCKKKKKLRKKNWQKNDRQKWSAAPKSLVLSRFWCPFFLGFLEAFFCRIFISFEASCTQHLPDQTFPLPRRQGSWNVSARRLPDEIRRHQVFLTLLFFLAIGSQGKDVSLSLFLPIKTLVGF